MLTVSGCTLYGNSATRSGHSSFGGGIDNAGGTATVSGSTLYGNSATYGGGIYNNATLTVNSSTSITGNTAPVGFGADVYNQAVLYWQKSTSTIGFLDGPGVVYIS
jgi:hypothetical protein